MWYPPELCSAGSDTPQDFVRRSIRPRRTSVCFKIYTSLSLFCRVWYPAEPCSAVSDTVQDFVLRGIRPLWQIKTLQNQTKSFKSLPFSLKGLFSKIVFMYKLYYPRLIVFMLKEPPISKMVFCSTRYETPRNHFEFEYLGEFEIEIKNILEHESRAHMGLIHEKNQKPKISCYCTFYRRRKKLLFPCNRRMTEVLAEVHRS